MTIPDDKIADYVPTQIIAELFKANDFDGTECDGIQYQSLFNGGKNLALYDIGLAEQIDDGKVIQLTKIDVDFKVAGPIKFKQQA